MVVWYVIQDWSWPWLIQVDPSNCGDVIKILDNDSQITLMHNNYVSFKTVLAFNSQLSYPLFASIQRQKLIVSGTLNIYMVSLKELHLLAWGHLRRCNFFLGHCVLFGKGNVMKTR